MSRRSSVIPELLARVEALAPGEVVYVRHFDRAQAGVVTRMKHLVEQTPDSYELVRGPRGGVIGLKRRDFQPEDFEFRVGQSVIEESVRTERLLPLWVRQGVIRQWLLDLRDGVTSGTEYGYDDLDKLAEQIIEVATAKRGQE